jgi:zinc protease
VKSSLVHATERRGMRRRAAGPVALSVIMLSVFPLAGAAGCGVVGGRAPATVTPDAPFRQHAPTGTAERMFVPPLVQEGRLANGVRVFLAADKRSPLVALSIAVSRGAAAGPPGLANLAYQTLYAGTTVHDRSHIASGFQEIGAMGTMSLDHGSFAFHYTVLPSGREKAMALLAEMLRRPNLRQQEFDRDQSWLVTQVRARSPTEVMDAAVSAALYPPDHPYHFDPDGDEASIVRLTRADVVAFLRTYVQPDQVVVAAAGNVGWDALLADVTAEFGDWKGVAPPERPVPEVRPQGPDAPVVVIDRKGFNQSEIRVVALSPPVDSPDRLPFLLLATALGGNFTSRMNLNLRERHGYGYSPHTRVETRRGSGKFTAVANVVASRTGDALKEMLIELDRACSGDLSADELTLAKIDFLRTIPERFLTTRATSQTLARLAAARRPVDEHLKFMRDLPSIDTGHVRLVAEQYLTRDKLRVVIMGDASIVQAQLADYRLEVVPMTSD